MAKAILHIGGEKTGTTSLQNWLSVNQAVLAAHGYRYSQAAVPPNHFRLAAYAQADGKVDDLRINLGLRDPEALDAFRRRFADDLAREATANADHVTIYSSEHCQSRLVTVDEVRTLHALLAGIFDEIAVVVYLRRQDRVAVSRYSTLLKHGNTRSEIIDQAAARWPFYNYNALVKRWAEVFGEDRLSVRLFEKGELAGDSVVADFCSKLGITDVDEGPSRANEALRPDYQEFLRQLNTHVPLYVDGEPNVARGRLDEAIAELGSGSGRKPPRLAAKRFYKSFRQSNELLRKRCFPEREKLFDEDFSDYPRGEEDAVDLNTEHAVKIAADLWTWAMKKNASLRAEMERLRQANEKLTKSLTHQDPL